jgi:DNA-binding transcriptional LysR family regulator
MSSRIDLVTLALFIAVCEETVLARAAERMHLAASAISKRLADLEQTLNVKLFERRPTGMFPTAAGTALLNHARLIMRNIAELEAEMIDFSSGLRGTIRVQANTTAMAYYLPDDLKTFIGTFPNVRIEIEESTSPMTLRAVAENAVDIGIYGDVVVPSDLDAMVYRHDRLALLVPLGHPLLAKDAVMLEEAVPYPFIGTPLGASIDTALTRAANDLGASLTISIRSAGFDAISRLVDAGLGIAVIPEAAARLYARSLSVEAVRLKEVWANRRLMICVRNRHSLTPPAAAFFAHLTRTAEKEAVPVEAMLATAAREIVSSQATSGVRGTSA